MPFEYVTQHPPGSSQSAIAQRSDRPIFAPMRPRRPQATLAVSRRSLLHVQERTVLVGGDDVDLAVGRIWCATNVVAVPVPWCSNQASPYWCAASTETTSASPSPSTSYTYISE